MKKRSIEGHLAQAHTLLENAMTHPQINIILAEYGYTLIRLQEGEALLNEAKACQSEKDRCYSQKKALANELKQKLDQLKALYTKHLRIARFAFVNDTFLQEQLQLNGTRKSDNEGWIAQVYKFYTRLEKDPATLMKKYGATAEELTQGKTLTEAIMNLRRQLQSVRGDAQSATQKRNKVNKELTVWLTRFKRVGKGALQEDSQLLESLGILVRTA